MQKIYILLISVLITSCASIPQAQEKEQIDKVLNEWHHAAAVADEDAFFGAFAEDGIYIGTDATEHWTAKELQEWSVKAFAKESAWAFESYNRHIFFSKDGKTAWFDELLNTWMGTCRGSGVLEKVDGDWKIAHYHLAVAVPNQKINDYLDLLKED
ncbi:nuclear transport factor 2 family protein [Weeksellaceae bacterium KMM 9713]|uniref:Nuclear transport factor 2 family protein n=1 Tax=Profundicola chukchiensis TaxID=2961959 RepID=A0A9X4MYG8_9FLAO|nr:nuclear transport factor 2 family protein [Profundicola chukchiensis]MDG4946309.1 nuclear transport factor 2 family protein [Profundicola chukchiensis]MDG4950849.1 nuclear transport factor 2 family protein [Profundicola chukchiensis]